MEIIRRSRGEFHAAGTLDAAITAVERRVLPAVSLCGLAGVVLAVRPPPSLP